MKQPGRREFDDVARTAWVWTSELRRAVQATVLPGRSAQAIAQMHGLSTRTVENAYQRGILIPERQRRSWKRPTIEVVDLVDRDCLGCQRAFKAEGRLMRLCTRCSGNAARACTGVSAQMLEAV